MGARSIRTSTGVGLHVEVDGPPDAPVTVVLVGPGGLAAGLRVEPTG